MIVAPPAVPAGDEETGAALNSWRENGDAVDGQHLEVDANDVSLLARLPLLLTCARAAGAEERHRRTSETLRETLVQLSDLQFEYTRLINAFSRATQGLAGMSGGAANGYPQLVRRLRKSADVGLPPDATVVVVSKGDPELLKLGRRRRGLHFPQTPDGVYAGHYPRDAAAAVRHLEELRRKGAEYLILPSTAFWWLEHYAGLKRHLESRGDVVMRHEDTCVIFALTGEAFTRAMERQMVALQRRMAGRAVKAKRGRQSRTVRRDPKTRRRVTTRRE
jgi:hypothetical protein